DGLKRITRQLATLEEAARRYPGDADVWFELGEIRYHFGERMGRSQREALNAFENAIEIDSAFAPAYYHAVELTLVLVGADSARRLAQRYESMNPGDNRYRLLLQLLAAS